MVAVNQGGQAQGGIVRYESGVVSATPNPRFNMDPSQRRSAPLFRPIKRTVRAHVKIQPAQIEPR